MLHNECLFTLDANKLSIKKVINIEYGKEESTDVHFEYKVIQEKNDYTITRTAEDILINVGMEMDTGYTYHFKVHAMLEDGTTEKAFIVTVVPRGMLLKF